MIHKCFAWALAGSILCFCLPGCASDRTKAPQEEFKVVGERTFQDVPFEHMYTLARRTMRDMHLNRETVTKEEAEAFLVFEDPEIDFGEMAMDIRPAADDGLSTHVTLFAHDRDAKDAAEHILDNLKHQIALDHDVLHEK